MDIIALIIAFGAIVLLTGADQLIKIWAVENLKGQPSKEFISFGDTKILNLTYLENDGAVFGSFSGMRWILVAVTAALMIFCVCYMIKHKNEILTLVSMTLIVSGGLGNIIDRLFRGGSVVDYFDVQFMNFAVFNFADCCVVVGVILLLIQILFSDLKNRNKSQQTVKKDG
ncbi:MAG: signal peptidase II [Porcipelethomonas sp.]